FSGTNAHVLLEEAPALEATQGQRERPLHVLTLSTRTEPALRELADRCRQSLEASNEALGDICHTANAGRSHFEERLAVLAATTGQVRERLEEVAAGRE